MLTHKPKIEWGDYIVPLLLLTTCLFGFLPNSIVDVRLGKQVISEWCVTLFAILFFLRNKYIKTFLCIVFIRYVLMYFYPIYGVRITTVCIRSAYVTINTILVYCLFYEGLCHARMNKKIIYNILCGLGLIQSTGMILQYFGIWLFFRPTGVGVVGFFTNPNMAGSFLAIISPCFFRKKWCYLLPLVILGLFLSKTEAAILPFAIFLLIFVYFKLKSTQSRFFLVVGTTVLASLFFHNISFRSMEIRFDLWRCAYEGMIKQLPIIGYGPGQFKLLFPKIYREMFHGNWGQGVPIQAHNEYIQGVVEFGLLGVGVLITYIVKTLKRGLNLHLMIPTVGILIALVNSGANFLFHTVVCVIVLIYFSIIEKESVK